MAAQDHIRRYLAFTRDPGKLIDHAAVKALTTKLETAEDPVERVLLRQQLINASQVDEAGLTAAFCKHVKPYAETNGLSWQAFAAEGVARSVLARAGFPVRSGTQARRVTGEFIRSRFPTVEAFSTTSMAALTGAHVTTVRKVIARAVAAGDVVEVGEERSHHGTPTKLYRRAGVTPKKARRKEAVQPRLAPERPLSAHALDRIAEMGLQPQQVLEVLADPELDYDDAKGRVAVRGDIAVAYGDKVITVFWHRQEAREHGPVSAYS